MTRMTKEIKAAKKLEAAAAEYMEESVLSSTITTRLLKLMAKASKFADRISFEVTAAPLAVTFMDHGSNDRITVSATPNALVDWYNIEEVEYTIRSFEREREAAEARYAAVQAAKAKLTAEEIELLRQYL